MIRMHWRFYKKWHKWPGVVISLVLLYYGVTGVFMNHRATFSGLDVDRQLLPTSYTYTNWNLAAVKGSLWLTPDSVLVYGNVGMWLTDSTYTNYTSFNNGLPKGSDNRKVFDVYRCRNGHLYAATLFGLYAYEPGGWRDLSLNGSKERVTAIEGVEDTLYVTDRSYLYKGVSKGGHTTFETIQLPTPEGFEKRISLFASLWQIHSGEVFGLPGKLVVDALGLVTVFLSLTGLLYFFFPGWIKRRKRRQKPYDRLKRMNRWSLNWHNHLGAWSVGFLIVVYLTGLFLRPPFLIAIANAKVRPIPYSHLDQPNPWYDSLRDLLYDAATHELLISTSEGMFAYGLTDHSLKRYEHHPPISVMGITAFEKREDGSYLVGSFSGLFLWHPARPQVLNAVDGSVYVVPSSGRPVGDYKVTGTVRTAGGDLFLADYDKGMLPVGHDKDFPPMPEVIKQASPLSLWNVCLEIHTGRFFQDWLNDFYLLIVPLTSLLGSVVVISGYLLWRRKYRRKATMPS